MQAPAPSGSPGEQQPGPGDGPPLDELDPHEVVQPTAVDRYYLGYEFLHAHGASPAARSSPRISRTRASTTRTAGR
ncbi:hypothetical protein GCM10010277_75840 [Streptomyces longisporoflavus]|nr:hypothetical protein GCM10010277_75840 [Streptomyces longisporoflavus]